MLFASMVVGMVFGAIFPGLMAEYENTNIFRPWTDPLMNLYYVHPFLLGIFLAFAWSKGKGLIKEKDKLKKGALFGVWVWILFGTPGMLMTIASFQVSVLIVLTWTVSILIQDVLAGIVFAYMDKRK
jgi:hypothetical protein